VAKETILIVDNEQDILELLSYNLQREGYRVVPAESGEAAIDSAVSLRPELIVLDLMLPGIDGVEVCRRLRSDARVKDIPIIMLTAKSEDSDIISGLEVGADDYVTKPFSPKVLIARIRSRLRSARRSGNIDEGAAVLSIHGISIDTVKHEVRVDGRPVELSATEFSILEILARNPGWVYSRSKIIGQVKGDDYPVTERSVDVHILGLRKKLAERGECIETVRGVGYRMSEESRD
jgi:two-component system phosphate regulon response regulator PhoB